MSDPAIPPPSKSIFKSKAAFAAALTALVGALGNAFPETVGQNIAAHASTILLVSGAIHFALRLATKGRVTLFPE